MRILAAVTAASFCGSVVSTAHKNLIIDTDLHSDVDDAGALLLGATLSDVNLLGVIVNHPCEYSALAASAILAHYGHPDTPIGIPRPLNNKTFFDSWYFELGEYTSKVAHHWSGEDAWDPVALYRSLLSAAENDSVTIASIGFLDNLSGLLNSTADKYSDLNGRELLNAKVTEIAIMGGGYPSGHSWNFFGSNPILTAHVINTWEGKMTFVGDDVGKYVLSGAPLLASKFKDDPVRMGYLYYGFGKPLSSWDPLTVLYVATGLGDLFELGTDHGYNKIWPNGTNEWVYDASSKKQQNFLRLKASNETAANELDHLYLIAATKFSKYPTDKEL
ncbi:Inosine/uridine-preferring nucleoside hydrolase domain-containing protein [Phaeosphaeriaceae sp. PMI808]|nr:Inosine/uridine-preferring nucleoside hydrolase domain-containing protein [Phaeosphaeriaceae sp. PMI808]